MVRFFLVWNIAVFAIVGLDKLMANLGRRRISESTLLLAAFFGAAPGLWAGMLLFRHKTQKRSFLMGAGLATVTSVILFVLGRTYGPLK